MEMPRTSKGLTNELNNPNSPAQDDGVTSSVLEVYAPDS